MIAVAIGFVLSFALALLVRRVPAAVGPVTFVGGILYTIPSLALFAVLVPITGFTLVTAEIALVSYTLLILVRNIVAGLDGVPAEVIEAARAWASPAAPCSGGSSCRWPCRSSWPASGWRP